MSNLPSNLEGLSAEDIARLASISQALLTDPAVRTETQRLVKRVDQTASFPELEMQERLDKQRQEFSAELLKRDQQEAERRSAENRQRSLESLGNLLPQEAITIDPEKKMAPIEEYMVRNKIGDYSTAARLFALEQAPAPSHSDPFAPKPPASPSLPTLDLEGKNLRQWALDEAYKTYGDLKSGRLKVNDMGVPLK